jgi:N-acyl-D-amino-acid deacylase
VINLSIDLIIRNGKVVDGTGNPGYRADIGIAYGKIVKIKRNLFIKAENEIDASDHIVCPGFIDIHSHTDIALLLFKKMQSSICQGITTSVVGMCGQGLAPVHPEKIDEFKLILKNFIPKGVDFRINWQTFNEYLGEVEKYRCPGNLAFLVGYENIRVAGGQGHENRPPTKEELDVMKEYVKEAMEAGAFGMSTGLIYAPQVFANTSEIIEIMKEVAKYNGLYFSHIRNEGEKVIEAVKEFIEIVEKSGCAGGQIAHHKVAGKAFWGLSKETLSLIEEANERGVSITCDQYPYKRGLSTLITALPPWVQEGGVEMALERLKSSKDREKIKEDVEKGIEGWENWIRDSGFDHIYISLTKSEKWRDIKGKNISEITKLKGMTDDWETLFEMLIDENTAIFVTTESQSEEDIRRIMTSKYQMFGTDGVGIPKISALQMLHPRCYGTYPRILGRYVREEDVLTLEEAIRKMTSFPAQRLGLKDRGTIGEGMWADIVIFNPEIIKDNATYDDIHQYPDGIPYVIVNGVVVVEKEKILRKYPGKVLRRPT